MKGLELLRRKIDESGYKLSFIAEKCGLTYQGFKKKLDGYTEFKVSEVGILRDLLHLTDEEVQAIFFINNVDAKSTNRRDEDEEANRVMDA